jgi:hypothetical protein
VAAKKLDVGDQVPEGVVLGESARAGLSAASLIEQNRAIERRIEELAVMGPGLTAGSAMKKQGGKTGRIPALLEVQRVP